MARPAVVPGREVRADTVELGECVDPLAVGDRGAPIPDTVEGRGLLPLLADGHESVDWREAYYGEHAPGSYHPENGVHYPVGSSTKYVWNPVTGEELLFDLDSDPGEERNLAESPDHAEERDAWRQRLIDRLDGRPEGFVEDGEASTIAPAEQGVRARIRRGSFGSARRRTSPPRR